MTHRVIALERQLSMNRTTPITSHVLDTSRGKPAEGITIVLEKKNQQTNTWEKLGQDVTNSDGRIKELMAQNTAFEAGIYQVTFYTQEYFERQNIQQFFYPYVTIPFVVQDPQQHYHVPLLLNPFGYSTYRGS